MPKKRSSSAANITNEDEKSQRKRVQNRISQRCSREKKLTQNRNIANFIELVKKAQTGSHENNKVLVNAYAELMQENDQLNEALLRMRKKLLSISNSSEAAANDPIFEKLLEPKGNQRHDLGLSNYAGHDSLLEGDDIERENRVGDPFGAFSREIDYDFLDHFVMPTPCDFPDGPARNVSFFRTLSPSPPTFAAPNSLIGSFGRLSYVRMMDALEKACMIYLCEELDVQHDSTKLHEPATLLDLKLRCMNIASSKMVHDLAAVAVGVAVRYSGVGDYLQGVGAISTLEAIIQWRLAPTEDNIAQIPEPFRPTPLQRNPTHSAVIDMLNWPHLRDRFIMLAKKDRTLNIDQAVRDILFHTVFEVPHLNLSFSTLDAYYNTIGHKQGFPPLSQHEIRRKFEGESPIISQMGCNYTAQYWFEIVREMSKRMHGSNMQNTPKPQPAENHFAHRLGVTRLSGWKLSRKWWEDHSYLVTQQELSTKYPTAAASDV
ncbi:conserved hypothetical protein [Pyrenophora tritici-repentis Pt-1C-BFP]|uniref:BZIP domain-containing protein n=1 Tax=Pyrenophora tritici-repentis (strain Pt-1C-BFP) TaxID=426418 RepID=B2W7E9_PYRTR|nr:uncharacterized protein PTRG_05737 [Pyrenophora tritici-repentis Pt-1C-BFP]EDU48657.1 conserved hypothetical protein [Pyrenophora tritici-repentis Pt-1C-BFP]KAI0570971.1 DUF3425 domain-containing protein [Pyrenophora tritici-repentis]